MCEPTICGRMVSTGGLGDRTPAASEAFHCRQAHRLMCDYTKGERPMFIFKRPLVAVIASLAVPALLVLLDRLIAFSAI